MEDAVWLTYEVANHCIFCFYMEYTYNSVEFFDFLKDDQSIKKIILYS